MPFKLRKSVSSTVLEKNDLPSLVEYIKSDKCQKIVVMLGAGVSTAAGIPDFRSPDTGLYANLQRLNLPYPEAVFDIGFFRKNPIPFYTLANELYPGKYRPTLSHSFVKLLETKELLLQCFTQNIDTLERRAGVSDDLIIEAHGSFASHRCINCYLPFDGDEMRQHILNKAVAKCNSCGGLVKPDIVFFGESLPDKFIKSIPLISQADLVIIMGTSLTVHPFASLASLPEKDIPRVLINLEQVGNLGMRGEDVLLLGKCDDVVRELVEKLGWESDLMKLWDSTKLGDEEKQSPGEEEKDALKDAKDEVQRLTGLIEKVELGGGEDNVGDVSSEEAGSDPKVLKIPPKGENETKAVKSDDDGKL